MQELPLGLRAGLEHRVGSVGEQERRPGLLGQLPDRGVVDRLGQQEHRRDLLVGQIDAGRRRGERPPFPHHDLGDRLVLLARLSNEQVGGEVGVLHPLDDVQLVPLEGDGVDLERAPVGLPPLLGAKQILERGGVGVPPQRRDEARVGGRVPRLQLQLPHVGRQRIGGPHAVRLRDAGRLLSNGLRPIGLDGVRDGEGQRQDGACKEQREGPFHPPILSRTGRRVNSWSRLAKFRWGSGRGE